MDETEIEAIRRTFMRLCWEDAIERWRHPSTLEVYPQAQRLLAAGADPETLRLLCGSVALDTLAYLEHHVDYGFDPDAEELEPPGWALVATDPATGEPTQHILAGLHESGLHADPSGREGHEFWKAPDDAPGIDFDRERWRDEPESG